MPPASQRVRHWDDSFGANDAHRWMLADLILEQGELRAVLDAKCKCNFGRESRNDRFQICAYALAFDSERVVLVYPQESAIGKKKTFGDQIREPSRLRVVCNLTNDSRPNKLQTQGPRICRRFVVFSDH